MIEFEVPVIELLTVSVAVIDSDPAVFNVAEKVPTPAVSVEFAGNVAWASLDVKCAMPVYPLAVLLNPSSAVTVTLIGVPDVAVPGALTEKCDAAAAFTVTDINPVMEPVAVSVAVRLWLPAVFNVTENTRTPLSPATNV